MKKSLVILAALAALSTAAFATGKGNDNSGGNSSATGGNAVANPVAHGGNAAATGGTAIAAPIANGGTGLGVGVGHGGSASTGAISNTNTANGGQGGQGGRGGDGGSVLGSGNSSSSSGVVGSGNSSNTNVLGQNQGQAQGQQQGQVATGGAGGSASAGASSNSGGNTMSQTGGAHTSTQANSVTVTGDTVTYQAQERNPVASAWAPSVAPTALCALGVSGGAQGVSFGLSFGKAYIDDNCQLLEQIRATATVLGDRATAAEMMCDVPAYKAARARAGKPCSNDAAKISATPATTSAVASAAVDEGSPSVLQYQGNDPIVLKRLAKSSAN